MSENHELTHILQNASKDPEAAGAILPRVYDELRRIAQAHMNRERDGMTIQATALVHEAWIGLCGTQGEALDWNSRGHFFSAAARAMRQILVDRARRVHRVKHGGAMQRRTLDRLQDDVAIDIAEADEQLDFVALDRALQKLAGRDPRMAKVVDLRFFAGLSVEDTARALDISPRTVKREWAVARAWLQREIDPS